MPQDDLMIWLTIFSVFVTILVFMFAKETKERQIILGVGLLAVLLIFMVFALLPTPYPGWVICWHGYLDQSEKQGYEFLVAYPESAVRQGLSLSTELFNPWNGKGGNYINDSLKSCLYEGKWYGSSDLDWYPSVSYLKIERGYLLACHDAPRCGGQRWSLYPGASPPDYVTNLLREPSGNSIQILEYTKTP